MELHTTNYYNTFIQVADDCPAGKGEVPPLKANAQSIVNIQFELIINNPYQFTSDDILFNVFVARNNLSKGEYDEARAALFSKGQACLRSSPLTKRYGWGVHANADGKVALYGVETSGYQHFVADENLKKVKAMRSKRA